MRFKGEMVAGPLSLSRRLIKRHAEHQYTTFDERMKVWVWKQIILAEISGDWTPEVVSRHLKSLQGDFLRVRRHWKKVFLVVDGNLMNIQSEAFRSQLKTDWELLFNRDDLLMIQIDNNTLRRVIRQSVMKLVPGVQNIRICKDDRQAFELVRAHSTIEETDGEAEVPNEAPEGSDMERAQGEGTRGTPSVPEKLTLEWVTNHSNIRLVGADLKWTVTAWRNVIFLKISEEWTPEEMEDYVGHLSALPTVLTEKWDCIFFVFDLSHMQFEKEELFRYLSPTSLAFLERKDVKICLVEENASRRFLLRSVFTVVGKLDKIRLFAGCDNALGWVRDEIISSEKAACEVKKPDK